MARRRGFVLAMGGLVMFHRRRGRLLPNAQRRLFRPLRKELVMAQDDRKWQPSTRGRSPAPNAPDTPDTRAMNAPPPPELPEAPDTPRPVERPARDGDSGGHAVGPAEKSESDWLRDYASEVEVLRASERGLRQYCAAEVSFLERMMPASALTAIAEVHQEWEQEMARLRTEIEQKSGGTAEARAALAEARQAVSRARALERPASSIRDRIKRAYAIRDEAKKASDAGHYALAYWLVMPGGRLDRAINAEPQIIDPEDLGAAMKTAVAEEKEAEEQIATLTGEIGTIDASVQNDRAELVEKQRRLEAAILAKLFELNPRIHPAD